jgi:uncharacterized protein (DUF362 family)
MSKVALVRCESYEYEAVKKAVSRGLELLGGVNLFAKKDEKILLKPNLLIGEAPEKCVTTHPAVFRAVAELLQTTGAHLSYGDSPAFGSPEVTAKKSGLADVAEKLNIELADFKNGTEVFYDQGKQNKKFVIAKGIIGSDGVISLPKLKTHALAKLTGSVKNQFGCIPGTLKAEFHVKLADAYDFAKMLVDLNRYVNPRLYVMDGIYAMEGNGPRGGTPRKLNILLFSADPLALDATVCRLVDVDPELVPTIKYGAECGHGVYASDKIELIGDDFASFKATDFAVDRAKIESYKPGKAYRFINNLLVPKPFISAEKCVQCGICVNICPAKPKALSWSGGDKSQAPVYNYQYCIRCYCCQELCPEKAISLKKPFLRRLFGKKSK